MGVGWLRSPRLEAGARLPLVKTAPHFSVLPRTGAVVRARVGDLAWPFLLAGVEITEDGVRLIRKPKR
jgi:hypothetical protein